MGIFGNKEDEAPKKKGNRSWRPAGRLQQFDVPEGYTPRWLDKDESNIDRKLAEGWELCDTGKIRRKTDFDMTGKEVEPDSHVEDGKPLSTRKTYRELILGMIPNSLRKERQEYYQERTMAQTAGLKKQAQEELDAAAAAHGGTPQQVRGKIIIE